MKFTTLFAVLGMTALSSATALSDGPLDMTTIGLTAGSTLSGDGGFTLTGTIGGPSGAFADGTTTFVTEICDDTAPHCPADFNQDNTVDFFDYLDFVDAFSNGGPEADFNHDAVIDFFDYLDFVDVFSAGC